MSKYFLNVDHVPAACEEEDANNIYVINGSDNIIGEFNSLKGSIFAQYENPDDVSPRSIPYSRAREYIFYRYLFEEGVTEDVYNQVQRSMHRKTKDEWLGFVSMIALSEIYNITITMKRIVPREFEGIGKILLDDRDTILPHNVALRSIANHNEGNHFIIYIRQNNIDYPIGLTNHYAIFVPGFWNSGIKGKYPWAEGTKFINPIKGLTAGEKMIVYKWLECAKARYKNYNLLFTLLNELLNDIALSKEQIDELKNAETKILDRCGDMNIAENVFNILLTRVNLKSLSRTDFPVDDNCKNILVNISNAEFDENNGIIKYVYGFLDNHLTLKLFKRYGTDRFTNIFRGEKSPNIVIIKKEFGEYLDNYIDTSTIYYFSVKELKGNTLFRKNFICDGNCYIIRTRSQENAEKNLTEIEIVNNIISVSKIDKDENGNVYLSYRFNSKDNIKRIDFYRELSLDSVVNLEENTIDSNVSTVYIWPYVDNCRLYYTNTYIDQTNEGTVYLYPRDGKRYKINEDADIITRTDKWPDFMDVYVKSDGIERFAGIVPIEPLPTKERDTKADYSIDFGTSSTNVGFRGRDSGGKNIFTKQLSFIAEKKNVDVYPDDVFYGSYEVSAPFPTILKKLKFGNDVFKDGHAFFLRDNKIYSENDFHKMECYSNIKFSGNDNLKLSYIYSLLNYIIIDAKQKGMNSISLYISYSLCMQNIELFVENIINLVKEINASNFYNVMIDENIKFISESAAALKYVKNAADTNEIVVVDIGGGSVDICIHSPLTNKKDILCRTASFKQGSRYFFIKSLKKNQELINYLMGEMQDKFNRSVVSKNATYDSEVALETTIAHKFRSDDGEDYNIGEEIKNVFINMEGIIKKYYQTLWMLQMASNIFYCALLAAEMQSCRKTDDCGEISIKLAGRGSKVIDWLPKESIRILEDIFDRQYNESYAGRKEKCEISFDSKSVKNETILGMFKNHLALAKKTDFNSNDFSNDFLRGEKKNRGNQKSELEYISDGNFEFNPELPIYNKFLNLFNELGKDVFLPVRIADERASCFKQERIEISIHKINKVLIKQKQDGSNDSVFLTITETVINEMCNLGGGIRIEK